MSELFIGLMSGTSVDSIDAALTDFTHHPPRLVQSLSHPIPDPVRARMMALADGELDHELDALGQLDVALGRLFAEAVQVLLQRAGIAASRITAIGSHGQTARHCPGGATPYSLQIGDPNIIAHRTGITTVADFRRQDLAAGGQGAPLVPAFHSAVLRARDETRVVLNLGGIANITLLPATPAEPVIGFDTGPGNLLLDLWYRRHRGGARDEGGQWGASGTVQPRLLTQLLDEPYFQRPPPKSTGRELFNARWLERVLADFDLAPAHVQATLGALTATTAASAIQIHGSDVQRVLVCGGGVHNAHVMGQLRTRLAPIPVDSTADWGVDPDWMEALAFAWLARQRLAGEPGNLPSVTGASTPVCLGGVYAARPSRPSA